MSDTSLRLEMYALHENVDLYVVLVGGLSMTDLDRLEALEKEATPGPWHQSAKRVVEMPHRSTIAVVSEHYGSEADAALIAALRNAAPALIAVARAAEDIDKHPAVIGELRAALARLNAEAPE